ncbi:RICIN domain-containing protein [Streptomyces violascens]|uniref:RICIN domain-containing protein n=1 Tax=Streptomyces violascens TaxID=67381 RepID=UPI0036B06A9A
MARAALALATVPVILAAVSTPASASSNITWQNKATHGCLQVGTLGGVGSDPQAWIHCASSDMASSRWNDDQDNLDSPNGAWKITTRSQSYPGRCLASWYADPNTGIGNVYVEPCASPANWYQQWYENWKGDGMQLVNRQTGLCLDANKEGDVYTHPCNDGDNQIWK